MNIEPKSREMAQEECGRPSLPHEQQSTARLDGSGTGRSKMRMGEREGQATADELCSYLRHVSGG
jgi:hypothetical protein